MELYGNIYNVQVKPKKEKLDEAEAELREKQRILAIAEAKIRELEAILEKLKKEHEEKLAEKDALAKKAEELMRKLQRAAMLVDGLSGNTYIYVFIYLKCFRLFWKLYDVPDARL